VLESTIAKNYVKCLTEFWFENKGVIIFPKALGTAFIKKYEAKCEYREKVTSLLWLYYKETAKKTGTSFLAGEKTKPPF
jgi:hypothetical protein